MYNVARAKFEKVSFKQYLKDFNYESHGEKESIARVCYEELELPCRKTKKSAGYDFSVPYPILLNPHTEVFIPTGIKCSLDSGFVLKLYPRSSLGFKYRIALCNTVGIIDADYYNNESNEGNIGVKLFNPSDTPVLIPKNQAFCQGIIEQYFLAVENEVTRERTGGVGSTNI